MNILFLILILIVISPARAALSEPDNLLYGAISLNNQPVTAARTDVVVEARRAPNGPAIARFRMGSDPTAGNFYALRIPIESLGTVGNPNAAQVAETLYIVALGPSGQREQATYLVAERGGAQRLDLGAVGLDSDSDFLPDPWEIAWFGNLNREWNTPSPNGLIAWDNYTTGSNPNTTNGLFRVTSQLNGNQLLVSFYARRSSGIGYEGTVRYYSLETATHLDGPWTPVPAYNNLLGNDRTIFYQTPLPTAPTFYRGQVFLAP